jgi:hypothetical protein
MPQTRTAQNQRSASAQRKPSPFRHMVDRFFLSERNVAIARAAAKNVAERRTGLRLPVRFDRTSQAMKPSVRIKVKGKNPDVPVMVPIKFIAQGKAGRISKSPVAKPVSSRAVAVNRRVVSRKKPS